MSLARLFRRRPRVPFREWGSELRQIRLNRDGAVNYAQWLHPLETPKTFDQNEVDGLRKYIEPGDFVIDVGAHTGDTALPLALAAGKSGCVLALEPNRYVYKILERNASLNTDRTHIEPRCFAATDEDGTYTFNYSDASFCNGGQEPPRLLKMFHRQHHLEVKGRNLLAVLRNEFAEWLPKLTFVKVDAEGFDSQVLASILPVIEKARPTIRTEVFRKLDAQARRALYDLIASAGYKIHRFQGGASPAGPLISTRELTAEKHFDILAVHPQRKLRSAAA